MIDADIRILDDIDLDNPVNPYAGLNRGLAAWWKVLPGRNGGSRWWDLLKRYPGTLTNMGSGSGWGGSPAPGGYGSLRFDATDDYVAPSAHINLCSLSSWSVSVSFNSSNVAASFPVLYGEGSTTSGVPLLWMGTNASKLYFEYRTDASADMAIVGATALSNSTWYRYTVTRSGSNFAIYLNGVSDGTGSQAFAATTTNNSKIGCVQRNAGPSFFWPGLADNIRIYSRALSASDVFAEYLDALLGNPATLNRIGGAMSAAQQARIAAMNHMLALNARRAS